LYLVVYWQFLSYTVCAVIILSTVGYSFGIRNSFAQQEGDSSIKSKIRNSGNSDKPTEVEIDSTNIPNKWDELALLTLFTKGNFLAGFLVGWDSLYEIETSEFFSRK